MKRVALLMGGLALAAPSGAAPTNGAGYAPAGSSYAGQAIAPSDNAIFEVLSRVEQLQSEVQQLRGMVEEQSQTIADLQRKQGNMYSDLDDRMQALSANANGVASAGTTPAQPASTAPAQPGVANAQTAAPAASGSVQGQPNSQVQVVQPAVPAAVAESKPASAPTTNPLSEKDQYQQAYETLRNGHNSQAIKMFQDLLTQTPAGEFSDNAQYWLAEAHKINREYDAAKAAFNKVVSQYPNSSKVPDALLKLGYIEFDLQNNAKARDYLTRVTTSYPGTTAAHLAAKKLAQMP